MGEHKHKISAREAKQQKTEHPGALEQYSCITDRSNNQRGSACREGCIGDKKVEGNVFRSGCEMMESAIH